MNNELYSKIAYELRQCVDPSNCLDLWSNRVREEIGEVAVKIYGDCSPFDPFPYYIDQIVETVSEVLQYEDLSNDN